MSMTAADLIALDEQWSTHNYHPLPVVIAETEGVWVTDVAGALDVLVDRCVVRTLRG